MLRFIFCKLHIVVSLLYSSWLQFKATLCVGANCWYYTSRNNFLALLIFIEILALGSHMLPSYPACSWPLIFMKCLWSHLLKKSLWRIIFNPRFIFFFWLFLQSCLPSSVGGCFQPECFALLIVLTLNLSSMFFINKSIPVYVKSEFSWF